MPKYGKASALDCVRATFHGTPMGTEIAGLKSDKCFQLAEATQLNFLIKTKLIVGLLKNRYSFVNVSQLIKFPDARGRILVKMKFKNGNKTIYPYLLIVQCKNSKAQ
jgi:hypothetical protein